MWIYNYLKIFTTGYLQQTVIPKLKKKKFSFIVSCCFWSVTQLCLTLWPHGLQHTRPLCPSPSPEVCPSSFPLHWWYHPSISSSDALFSFCPQSFPASGTFQMSQLFASCDQNNWSFGFSVSPTSEYSGLISLRTDWFDLLPVQGTLRSLLQHHSLEASVLSRSAFFMV